MSRPAALRRRRYGSWPPSSGPVPLVLTVPTPGRWLVAAAQQAGSDPGPPDAAQAETAAIYSADFLRIFADTGVDGLLLDEGRVPAGELIHPEAYRPVLNVAGHYEWPVLIQTDAAAAWPHGPVPGVAVWLGSDPPTGPDEPSGRWGMVAGPDFWDGVTRRPRPTSCSPPSRPRLTPKPS